MNRAILGAWAACWALACALPAMADETVVDLADLEAAADAHPSYRLALDEAEAARAELREATRWSDPVLGLSTGWAEALEDDHGGRSAEVEIELELPIPGRYRNDTAAARARLEAALSRAEATRLEVHADLAGRYWEIVRDGKRLTRLEQTREASRKALDVARRRVELGESRPVDLLRLEVEDVRLSAALRAAISEAGVRRRAFARQMGLPAAADLRLEGNLALPGEPLPFEELLSRLRRSHPDLEAASAECEAADASRRARRWEILADPSLRFFSGLELDAKEVGVGLSWPLPLWNRGSAASMAAGAERSAARHGLELARRELAESLDAAYARLSAARRMALALEKEILPKATESAEALGRMYEYGEVGVLDLIEARRWLLDAEMESLDALLECHLAHLELQTLTGGNCHEDDPR